jgi:ATP-dependent exoDNAse (exonuclease V) alpha subunit
MELTKEQKDAIKGIAKSIKSGKQIITCGGYAGTGKSTIIKVLLYLLAEKGLNFAPCAYTGKATSVLRKKGIYANTIHSTIYCPVKDKHGNVHWELLNVPLPFYERRVDGFVVDEASMVDSVHVLR